MVADAFLPMTIPPPKSSLFVSSPFVPFSHLPNVASVPITIPPAARESFPIAITPKFEEEPMLFSPITTPLCPLSFALCPTTTLLFPRVLSACVPMTTEFA